MYIDFLSKRPRETTGVPDGALPRKAGLKPTSTISILVDRKNISSDKGRKAWP